MQHHGGSRGRGDSGRGRHAQNPSPGFRVSGGGGGGISLEMVEAAVAKAKNDLLSTGGNVSTWKVAQSAAVSLQIGCWDSLGMRFNDVPTLRNLQFVEGKVNAFIHCFVSTRRMTSVHELGTELCSSEGVEQFDDLGLGPLLRHPLVQHYFSIPPDAMEVCKITVEEMIARLTVFQYRMKFKEFTVEEFLDFLVQKYSVASREKLGVRIQSMGMYIKFIRKIKRTEDIVHKSIKESGLPREEEPQRLSDSIPEHLKSLSFLIDDCDENNNGATCTVKDDSDGNEAKRYVPCNRRGKKKQSHNVQNSAYVDEMKLIGLKLTMFNYISCGKESLENEELGDQGRARYEIVQTNSAVKKLSLTNDELEKFISTWKGACQKHTVDEVLAMMLHIYKTSDKQKRKMERVFKSFPAVGLLNIAVRVIKSGELTSVIQDPKENIFLNPISKTKTEVVDEVLSTSTEGGQASDNEKCTLKVDNTSADDIIKQVASYFGLEHLVPCRKQQVMEEQAVIRDCEIWLNKKFSVKDFKCLGHGSFVEFLERHISFLPHELHYFIAEDIQRKSLLEVSMLQEQFLAFLFQAVRNLGVTTVRTGQDISILLRKQFPPISFQLTRSKPERYFQDLVKNQGDFDIPMSVTFSVALSENCNASSLSPRKDFHSEPSEMQYESVGALGSVSANDAINCLLRAPMLSDLQSWSHWDLIFAPSLGPLLEWLLSMGCIKELSCIVTCDGRIIRIDHSATLDDFLEASVLPSSFQAAMKLLSLFYLYGGSHNIPVALLKCYCQRAFDIKMKNYMDKQSAFSSRESLTQISSLRRHVPSATDGCTILFDRHSVGAELQVGSRICEDLSHINKAHAVIAMFILGCLGYLPSEFRRTAADILVSSLQLFTKDAALIMLGVCKTTDERIMLHDIGLSLGIMEWVRDYQAFRSIPTSDLFPLSGTLSRKSEYVTSLKGMSDISNSFPGYGSSEANIEVDSKSLNVQEKEFYEAAKTVDSAKKISNKFDLCTLTPQNHEIDDAVLLIQKIRHEEFGLDPNLENVENSLITKQHARLGRALHCLSQELYSQDSHFILELVQNADDNFYPNNVEPTLVFILHAAGIVVLNNERGFSAENIRALCDVGSSTKKGSGAGYIGKKGIGFKSVFRVSDAPEIHSNGFHVKFDITEGQIGFVLPTIISPCNIDLYNQQILCNSDQSDATSWNTCIVLPFNSKIKKDTGAVPIISMFSDLHPSLLLFLQRLRCIKFKNMLEDKLMTMKRERLGDGIIRVSHGKVRMFWLVVDKNLQASVVRPDVQSTKISVAFTLQNSNNGDYMPDLDQQPVFAFLPLRNYGLKFILQGDFILPSSREDVDGDSAWNQWLLSEFPDLFVSAENSFCMLPCFQESPGKAVSAFMSFVPLMGEVHGFFSQLPHMILSKLRLSSCLLLDGSNVEWVRPCMVLRNWDEGVKKFLPDTLLKQQLGLGYLCKDIILPDSLAKALGVQEYSPRFLIDLLSSICHSSDGIKVLGLDWLSSWLNALYSSLKSLSIHSSGYPSSATVGTESDLLNCLRQIFFIPLSDGSYGSLAKGPIWLPFDVYSSKFEGENNLKQFPGLYARLRTVNPLLFSTESTKNERIEETRVDNLIRMLCKIGVQSLSVHDVIRNHILPSISIERTTSDNDNLMIEYLSFIMIHLLSACTNCNTERDGIIFELRKQPVVLTNHGYKCPIEDPIHFSIEFGNSINMNKLLDNTGIKWNEVSTIYLKHSSTRSFSKRRSMWREFFKELGVTDFVQVVHVERNVVDVLYYGVKGNLSTGNIFPSNLLVKDWESPELLHLLCALSSDKYSDKCKYLLEVLDIMWDDCYSQKAKCYIPSQSEEESAAFDSSFMKTIHKFKWVPSSIDEDAHYPKDLFHDCESVCSILGVLAPYAVPKVTSKRFLEDIQFKVQVSLDDALRVILFWRDSEVSVSISQMSKFYTFIRDELSLSKEKITEVRTSISIFVPLVYTTRCMDVSRGIFMPPDKVYWHDPTGCFDRLKETHDEHNSASETNSPPCMTLANLYPGLHDFLVNDCGILETLPSCSYLQIMLQLSRNNLPSLAAHEVFQVFLKWADDLKSGLINSEELLTLKESLLKLENTVLPTVQGKWVSLHPHFGIVCWSDDDELMEQCMHLNDLYFLQFGELTVLEKKMLSCKVAALMQNIGIRALTEVVSREAIFYGIADRREVASLIRWVIPYMQRYLYKFHPDMYFDLKHCGCEKLAQLQVIAVEKLFYRYSCNGHSTANTKRYECSCLLQGNIFYTTPSVGTHQLFLEFSRFFFHGTSELQTANFLHMIVNMAGSGAEELEDFITNSQKVPVLPDGEALWSPSSLFTLNASETLSPTYSSFMLSEKQHSNVGKKQFSATNWPPTNWKTAPAFLSPSNIHVIEKLGGAQAEKTWNNTLKGTEMHQEHCPIAREADDKYFVKDDDSRIAASLTSQESTEDGQELNIASSYFHERIASSSKDIHGMPPPVRCSSTLTERDKLCFGVLEEEQSCITGRLGEIIAYKHFTEKLGPAAEVRWVNKEAETGLPYDLIIGEGGSREYIEVKSTTSATKDWFPISTKEFLYASEVGDSFSIARVIMTSPINAEISVFKNPLKLCRENILQLALVVPSRSDVSIT